MFHPLEGKIEDLKDSEVEQRLLELNKKYFQAYRLGKPELLTQLSTFVTIYKNELSRRNHAKMQGQIDGDLDQLINVD